MLLLLLLLLFGGVGNMARKDEVDSGYPNVPNVFSPYALPLASAGVGGYDLMYIIFRRLDLHPTFSHESGISNHRTQIFTHAKTCLCAPCGKEGAKLFVTGIACLAYGN